MAKGVENLLHVQGTVDEGGPDLYVIAKARSLVGKEKRGTTKVEEVNEEENMGENEDENEGGNEVKLTEDLEEMSPA